MKPEANSTKLLGVTRSRAKLIEFNVEEQYFNKIYRDPFNLLILTLSILGDVETVNNYV
ncbi:hypothetical protein [Planococcus sp. NCCP-2050]|uniref:hypothetical protein n=1 Tax=Planococcus sp. NCCP-2050 TaxID=2944679 RepID=UPI00203DA271|nr:hypothetical protein [Planococcus sp. NCCP-2050]GKW47019.1 hypothetical protein NCCP2050_27110 [Planococcus sp. NCCP-2050]